MSSKSPQSRRSHSDPPRPARYHRRQRVEANAPAPEGPLPPLVTDQQALRALVDQLRASGQFAYDSEFIGEQSYYPMLCLIQVATEDEVALIDPLADVDLAPFWELVADPAVEKIVHAGQQDLEPVCRHLSKVPANVFDTQIVAGFAALGYPVALSKLLSELEDVTLTKSHTLTQWDQRPLMAAQLHYAADDVRYLVSLRRTLGNLLQDGEHLSWAMAECQAMLDSLADAGRNGPSMNIRVRGAKGLNRRQTAVLRHLFDWRNEIARDQDMPPRTVLRDEALVEMAKKPLKQLDQLDQVRFMPRPLREQHGQGLLDATAAAMAIPEHELPRMVRMQESPPEKFAIDSLYALASALAHAQGIGPALVTNRDDVARFYFAQRKNKQRDDIKLNDSWRKVAVGDHLAAIMAGETRFNLSWQDGAPRLTGFDATPAASH